jgi:hypothetical protein
MGHSLLPKPITEIIRIQLPNRGTGFSVEPVPNNCVPFQPTRTRQGGRRRSAPRRPLADPLGDYVGNLSSSQYAFLSGVLAILVEHGEEALTTSCQMVIERFGRKHAG